MYMKKVNKNTKIYREYEIYIQNFFAIRPSSIELR